MIILIHVCNAAPWDGLFVVLYLWPDTNLRVPGRLRNLPKQDVSPQLKLLVVDRIMQCMGSDVPPVPIEAHFVGCSSCTCCLEYPLGDP